MTNHNPTFTSSSGSGSFTENANTTDSSALHLLSGTLNFSDSDHGDTHTTVAALHSVLWSGGSTIPTASLTDLTHAMSSVVQSDHNGSGTIKWSFAAADDDFDFLAKNETLVLTYDITVTDNHGGTATQTVKVTVTGTDDKPVISMAALAMVTEQANTTLSLAPDVTHVALHFVDPDLTNTNYTATVVGAEAAGATAGLLPGFLGTAELLAFFHIDNVVKLSGSSSGTVNTTFSAPDLAFDYLAAGQTLSITYTVQLDDHAGGTSTQNVVITVVGTNDKPVYISGPESAHLAEDHNVSPAGNLTAHFDLFFGDVDLSDTHTVTTTVSAARSGGGTVPLSNATLLAAMSTHLEDSTGHLVGEVDGDFALPNSAVNFLSGGETLTLTYHITVTDPAGGSDTQTVTVTILGDNHPVVITSGPESASLSEQAATTGSSALDSTTPAPTGTLAFSDPDTGDTHTVAVTVASTTWSGGSSIPAATQADLAAALATTLHDSTGTGTGGVDWTFSIPDHDLDFLASGETLTVDYSVQVSDASTHSAQTVEVTITGANDAPMITSGPEASSVAELPNTNGSSTLDTTSPVPTGTLSFTDPDLTDTHTVGVALASAVWSIDPTFSIPPATQADLMTALATTLHDSTGSGSGGVDWTFSIPDRDLDFLGAGETLTATYNVTVSDATTSSTQTVTITMTGAADPVTVNPLTTTFADTASQDAGITAISGNLITDASDNPGDGTNTLSITAVNGSAANVGNTIAGAYGNLSVNSDGFYFYVANSAVDPLQVGQNANDHFTFTVTDSSSHSFNTTLDINVVGADDAPVITAADASGSMTEDLGPNVVVNGGFETGDLTGWAASGNVHTQLLGFGGEFGNYAAQLGVSSGSLSQNIATTPGQHYTLSFYLIGDPDSTSNALTVNWDGSPALAVSDTFGGLNHDTLDVVGDATQSTTPLQFSYSDDGTAMYLDQITVESASGSGTENAAGTISFADVETADTHTASVQPQGTGYVGAFSLDPVVESGGSGSVGWHFTVSNADIQFLSQGQTLTQDYLVFVTDNHGVGTAQDVTITINGTNDAPTANNDTVVTDVGPNGTVDIPAWALAANATDPDAQDIVTPNSILSSSGGTAVAFGDAFFTDDATPGGSFTFDVTDGIAVSRPATSTVINNATSSVTLTGTSGDDILIANHGSEALIGGGGNDVLVGNGGSHILTGGPGNDIFAFQQTTDGPDTITDFNNITQHDRIAVSASGFGSGLTAHMDVSPVFETSSDNAFLSPFSLFHFDTTNQTLYFSPDGTTGSEIALAQLQPGVTLHAQDLIIT